MRNRSAAILLLAGLAGCAVQPRTALPDPAVLAAHEWDHGAPWGPEEVPWVAPPETYAGYYADSPWYWGGPAVGLGLGVRRGYWWGGGGRGHGSYGLTRGGWRGGGPGHFRGGGGGGRRGRR